MNIDCDFMEKGAPQVIAKNALQGPGSVEILINNVGGSRAFKLDTSFIAYNSYLGLSWIF